MYQGYPITHQILCLSTLSELAVSCQQAYCVFWDTHHRWLDSRFETSLLGAACVLLIIMAIRLVWAWLPHQCLILSQCLSSQVWDVLNATALKTWFCTRASLRVQINHSLLYFTPCLDVVLCDNIKECIQIKPLYLWGGFLLLVPEATLSQQ